MEGLSDRFIELAFTVSGTAIFALIGFVWKISHKVSELTKTVESMEKAQRRNYEDNRRDIDMLMNKMERNGEWVTNRMMSIAKDIKRD